MRKTTKYNLKTIFGSLISNQSAIDAGKTFPLWAAIIVFVLSVFLPIIPTMVSTANSNGSSYISTTSYSFDRQMTSALLDLHSAGYEMTINVQENDKYCLSVKGNAWNPALPLASYDNTVSNQWGLRVYVDPTLEQDGALTFFKAKSAEQFIQGTKLPKGETTVEGESYYSPNCVLFFKTGLYIDVFKYNSTTPVTNSFYGGDWRNTKTGIDIIAALLTVESSDGTVLPIPTNINNATDAYIAGVFKNILKMMDDCYLTNKWNSFTLTVLIYEGVYAGLIILLGLLVWALTRGKKNLNRYLKFMQCEQIVSWASLAPAILSLILGFILPNFAVMMFILFEGLRVMWLATRQLGPSYESGR